MDLFTYLMAKKGHNTHRDLFSYLLGKNAGGSGTYTTFSGTSLNISNTLQAKIKNIALEGNTNQDGTPTPEAPIPIKVVTGEQNVTIQNKNLCNVSQGYRRGYINANGGAFVAENVSYVLNQYIEVVGGNTYTYSTNQLINNMSIFSYNENKEFIKREIITYNKSKCTITVDSNAKYILLGGNYNNSSIITQAILNGLDIQLENGSTATSYVPYQSQTYPLSLSNIELAKIENYKDYIFKNVTGSPYYNANLDLNEWYLHKEINKVVFDGSESWTYESSSTTPTNRTVIKLLNEYVSNAYISNRFIQNSSSSNRLVFFAGPNSIAIYISLDNSLTGIATSDSDNTKLQKTKTYLSENNVLVYFDIIPTNTKITDTTLISQLENINNNARSYSDTTIIICSSESEDNETIGFSGEIKVTSVGLGNSLNTSLLSSNLQEETNTNDIQEEPNLDEIEEQNDEPIENEEIEKEVS